MSKSNVFRIIVLLAIVAGSLSLGTRPAAAATLPPEFQDAEWVCENLWGGSYQGGHDCVIDFETWTWFTTQGYPGYGYTAYLSSLWDEWGCALDEGVLLELQPIFLGGMYAGQWGYFGSKVIGCTDLGGAEGRIGDAIRGDEGGGTLELKPPRNGMMNYDAGTCDENNCRITQNLPVGAEKDLGTIPGGADATLYVNLGGGTGSYTVCFWGEGTIYQYISGLWQAIATSIGGGKSCASASGDGSFAFSEN
ncbi:MAG: hypothetical protein HYZ26_13980 [Chloroflexi bacterium]|nr:hypothetical protein [Chloroflexota bacterium]